MTGTSASAVAEQRARLEAAVAGLAPGADVLAGGSPYDTAVREALSDRVVDLLGARAWQRTVPPAGAGAALVAVAEECVLLTVTGDADRAGAPGAAGPSHGHRAAVRALESLVRPEVYDGLAALVRGLAGPLPERRLREPWLRLDDALAGLAATRHEWVGQEPRIVAAGCRVLVDRFGRLLVSAALIDAGRAAVAPDPGGPRSLPAERPITAARRYTWNHLRLPAPEAAVEIHLLRTRDLLDEIAACQVPAGGGR